MNVYISGGCKNGKSYHAQRISQAMGKPLYYLATMIPHDDEDRARIRRHLQERDGWGFETIECGTKILSALDKADVSGSFLLDSVTALLSNEMFRADGSFDETAPARVADELTEFIRRAPNTVMVSDYIYSDAILYDRMVEAYRAGLAHIDRRIARECSHVIEVVNGIMIFHRGENIWPDA